MKSLRGQGSGIATPGVPELLPHSFRYNRKEYSYDSLLHIGRFARRTSVNFVPVGSHVEINLWVRGIRTPITLTNLIGLAGTERGLEDLYRSLSERTFRTRMAAY